MSGAAARVGVGARFRLDGETVEVVEMTATAAGNEVVLKDGRGQVCRLTLKELLFSERARLIPDQVGPSADDVDEIASVVLGQLREGERQRVLERAEHVREVLTGFRSGSPELAREGEPRAAYGPHESLEAKYAAKATELGVGARSVRRWVAEFRQHGEAGLAPAKGQSSGPAASADGRWVETALEVMVEHTGQSKPSRTLVIERTRARVIARYGPDVVPQPSRATAFRILAELEQRHPPRCTGCGTAPPPQPPPPAPPRPPPGLPSCRPPCGPIGPCGWSPATPAAYPWPVAPSNSSPSPACWSAPPPAPPPPPASSAQSSAATRWRIS